MERQLQKKIGFLSFGHWQAARGSQTRTAQESLLQAIDLAVAAEEIGIDGAYFRVHHFARQAAAPFPVLAAIAARTKRIEFGTAVVDMRYENPLYMAEEAAATDLIGDGRLQLGISRGSPEPAERGWEAFGYDSGDDLSGADLARTHTELFRAAIKGAGIAKADLKMTGMNGRLAIQPQSAGLPERIWWGAGTRKTAVWTAEQGMNLMSSTLLSEDTGVPFSELQAEQIQLYRDAWKAAGWQHEPRVSVSRSVMPIVDDIDRMYFGARDGSDQDQVGYLGGGIARFGKSYIGAPDVIAAELAKDQAVLDADTLLLTVPNQLGVAYNAKLLKAIADHIAPAIGWKRAEVEPA
ncbi:LLM class flavin-dependent oxidoreductase [Kaistia defluvii]|uniref:LLM class flavin-dependent oxidoreductase n=1 Tax=Kaistia defluvii TaxID=410841 RepID=UPI00224DD507|nr:LLM class flavin-dependent oxidoreductase [Kaistia defluvii]MCX5516920.1 LLM class flavin-dependent oxidoreductase [Kaistia defluvii]